MAKKPEVNGHNRLEEAMALLIHNQAEFVSQLAAGKRESEERFARIEREMLAIRHVLAEHTRMLERLPEAVREKIGFRPQ